MKQCKIVYSILAVLVLAIGVIAAPLTGHKHGVSPKLTHARSAHSTLDATLCNGLVCVQTDEDGDFNIGTAGGSTLLYGYPNDPWSTSVRVSLDGQVYNLTQEGSDGASCQGVATFVNEVSDNIHIADNYTLPGNIAVTVTHTVVSFSDSSAAVLTRTVVTNNSGATHNIGVLYEYDTMVDDDDAATLYLGPNHITVATCYTAPFPYPYWDAIPYSGSLVGRGTITGGQAVTPDALAFGGWGDFYSTCWDDTCDGQDYGDSAVLYRWNEMPVASGQTRNVATYYGVGGINSSAGALHITVSEPSLACIEGEILPNPFQILVNVTDSAGIACNTISVLMSNGSGIGGTATITGTNPQTIEAIQPGNSSAVSFTAQLSTPNPEGGTVNFTVQVTAGNCAQNSADFSVDVPVCAAGVDHPQSAGLVTSSALHASFPNPFNAITNLTFDVAQSGFVTLKVYDLMGKQVASLVNGQMERGSHSVQFDASKLPSGVYLCRMNARNYTASQKMLLMK
ncbi:MAG TPA: T9SS type A sorting domain-containing protein [bacterium]|jgi:hypothetical protein